MGIVKNISPQNSLDLIGIKREDGEIVFSWYPVYGANNYTVEISTDKSFSSLIEIGETDYSYYKVCNNFSDEQELYCRINAKCMAKSYDEFVPVTAVYDLNGKIYIEDVVVNEDTISFDVTNDSKVDKDICIIVAEYSDSDRLVFVKKNQQQKINVFETVKYTISSDDTDYIKIFVWNDFSSISPLCDSKTIFLKENQ